MPCGFAYTPRFKKHFKNLNAREKKQLKDKLDLLSENPSHPSLRAKRTGGTYALFECSVNMDVRIIRYYEGSRMLVLLDAGHHDMLYKY